MEVVSKMKVAALILLFAVSYIECRKTYAPINKNANIDFINMESGGVRGQPAVVEPPKPQLPVATTKAPVPTPAPKPAVPVIPAPQKPGQPAQSPTQNRQVPVNPTPAAKSATTPGPGSVKSLINYYDSQGKASPIRPYSYSQAVKQG